MGGLQTDDLEHTELILYVSSDSWFCEQARGNLQRVVCRLDSSRVRVRVSDASREPPDMNEDHVYHRPMLVVRVDGRPRAWIAGDLADTEGILRRLARAGVPGVQP